MKIWSSLEKIWKFVNFIRSPGWLDTTLRNRSLPTCSTISGFCIKADPMPEKSATRGTRVSVPEHIVKGFI